MASSVCYSNDCLSSGFLEVEDFASREQRKGISNWGR
jgi:hypothetical protein